MATINNRNGKDLTEPEEIKKRWQEYGVLQCFPGKESACNAGATGSVPGSERFPGGGHGNSLQYSCLENPIDRGMNGKNKQKNYTKSLSDLNNHDGVVTHPEPDILECEAKWTLGSITTNKASGGNGIPTELFKTLKDDSVKMLQIPNFQQIWKTEQ